MPQLIPHTFAALLSLPLAACAQPEGPARGHYTTQALLSGEAGTSAITIDGDTADWPGDTPILADDHYLYLRFAVENSQYTLQSNPKTTSILLDLDSDRTTGETSNLAPFNTLGIDLEIDFSPRNGAAIKNGVIAQSIDRQGRRTLVPIESLDLICSPTYAASWYELRLSRTPSTTPNSTTPLPFPSRGLMSQGPITAIFATRDANGRISGYSDPCTAQAPPAARSALLGTADLPAKAASAVRVMQYNVEKSGPANNPELFKRLFQAAKPDIVLIEEWETGDAASVQAWFTAMVEAEAVWSVRKAQGDNSQGGGVAIVSRYPIAPLVGDTLSTPGIPSARNQNPPPHPVRFISATVTTPVGDFLVAATHLKCCGSKDTAEDKTRMAEAAAINTYLATQLDNTPQATIRLIAGDLNLVGSRPPLDLLRARLDSDKTDLVVANPLVLGDRSLITWRDPQTGFSPGRLDYILYSDANAEIVSAVVLDTARLSDESLARLGLDRTDSQASDHLPLIVDIKPRR